MISIFFPCRLVGLLNDRAHWAVRAKRAKHQRWLAETFLRNRYGASTCLAEPVRMVTITRLAPKLGLIKDSDNLVSSAKATRDGVADWLGVDDNMTAGVEWRVLQEPWHSYWVRVEIET